MLKLMASEQSCSQFNCPHPIGQDVFRQMYNRIFCRVHLNIESPVDFGYCVAIPSEEMNGFQAVSRRICSATQYNPRR